MLSKMKLQPFLVVFGELKFATKRFVLGVYCMKAIYPRSISRKVYRTLITIFRLKTVLSCTLLYSTLSNTVGFCQTCLTSLTQFLYFEMKNKSCSAALKLKRLFKIKIFNKDPKKSCPNK